MCVAILDAAAALVHAGRPIPGTGALMGALRSADR